MTIRAHLLQFLFDHGLSENDSAAIVAEVEKAHESMRGRWDDKLSRYPASMALVLRGITRREAVKWIEKNAPEHFAKELLTEPL